jgi:hypothetical protein
MPVFETPKYITCSSSVGKKPDIFEYVLTRPELEIKLNEISDKLQYPTTIIEFRKVDERTDSSRARILFSYCCNLFRNVGGLHLCTLCDKKHADLFRDVDLTDGCFSDAINIKIEKGLHIDKFYENSHAKKPQFILFQKDPVKGYLQYDCPIMGLRELIFPIVVEQKIIGVLFAGQIQIDTPENRENTIKIRSEFLALHRNFLNEYSANFPKTDINEIIAELVHLDDPRQYKDRFEPLPNVKSAIQYVNIFKAVSITSGEYENFIPKIFSAIAELESDLEKKLNEKRQAYIKTIFNDVISHNYREMQYNLRTADANMQGYWKALMNLLKNILKELNLQYISIFSSTPSKSRIKTKVMDLIAYVTSETGEKINDNNESMNNSFFDFNNINLDDPSIRIYKTLDSDPLVGESDEKTDMNLYDCIIINERSINTLKIGSQDIFLYPVRSDIDCSVAIVIGYKEHHNPAVSYTVKKLISKEIPQLITLISLIAAFRQNILSKRTLRIYRHEISQLTLGLRINNDQYLGKRKILEVPIEKLDDIYNDNLSSIVQLNYITQNAGMLLGSFTKENLEKTEFKIFKELLFKWQEIYKDAAHRKNIEFVLPEIYLNDKQRPLIFNDKWRLEQLIYNLVNNAMKYSYWGTIIKIDCKIIPKNPSKQCLSVTDYGYGIEEGDAPYQLYYRGSNLIDRSTEGSGIGLYVAREVAKLLDISLTHRSPEKISEYNIPLMQPYLSLPVENSNLYTTIKKEYEVLEKNGILMKVVSKKRVFHLLTIKQILKEITLPTYKVTFEVVI